MGNVRALRQATGDREPPRSEARAALAAAIARRNELEAEIVGASTAIESLFAKRIAATNAVETAERAIAEAKDRTTEHHIAVALGKGADRPLSIREAHTAHQTAIDEHAALQDAGEALEARKGERESRLSISRLNLDDAISAVIQSEAGEFAQQLVAEYEAIARDLADRRAVLEYLALKHVFGADIRWYPPEVAPDYPSAKAWQSASVALMADPDAPLPTPAPEPKSAA